LKASQQPLRKKGHGRLIHVSNFINPGRLVLRDGSGNIVQDAQKIIYPGVDGDPLWDTQQLLTQINDTIIIFETAFQDKKGLFIFDNSSAHGSLPADALKTFEMNKSDGGKQWHQQDTIIPESNPVAEHHGKTQKMTLPDGSLKGMWHVLQE